MKKIKIGLLGLGRAGWGIAAAELRELTEKYEIVAACDIIEDRCVTMKEAFSCRTYNSIDEFLLDPEMELVYIATRSSDHLEHGLKALGAGKTVVMEKPVTCSYNDAKTLFDAANKLGKNKLFVHQQRRFEPTYQYIKKAVDSGKLGDVFEINLEQGSYQRRDDWQTINEFGGGQLLNWGPHLIDHSLQLLGTKCANITSYLQHTVAAGDCEDHLRIRFAGDNGRVVNTCISGGLALGRGRYYEAIGTKGQIIINNNQLKIKYIDPEQNLPAPVANPKTPGEMAFGASGTFAVATAVKWIEEEYTLSEHEMSNAPLIVFWDYLYDTLINGSDFPVTDEDVLEIMRVISLAKAQSTYDLGEKK